MKQKIKYRKCPSCKGTGKVEVGLDGLTKEQRKAIDKKFGEYV